MRALDIGRFIRLRSAIQQSSETGSEQSAAGPLAESYLRFRAEALDLVPEGDREELQRVCPEIDEQEIGRIPRGSINPEARVLERELHAQAKVFLGSLAGFLDGYVEETRLRIAEEEQARLATEKGGQYL